jgi:hypothetical protein
MARKEVDLHHGAIGQIVDLIETGDWRSRCPSADVDEYLLGLQQLISDLHLLGRDESGVPVIDRASRKMAQPVFEAVPGYV